MKKILLMALAASAVISLCSCGVDFEELFEDELSMLEAVIESSEASEGEETEEQSLSEELTKDASEDISDESEDVSEEIDETSVSDSEPDGSAGCSEDITGESSEDVSDESSVSDGKPDGSDDISDTVSEDEPDEPDDSSTLVVQPEPETPSPTPDDSGVQMETEVDIDKSKPEGFYDGYGILKQADGSSFIYYAQTDSAYASHPYAGSSMGNAGCGPACMAMVISNFTDTIITPDKMGDWSTARGFAVNGRGSAYALFPAACEEYEIELSYLNYKEREKIEQALRDGKLIMGIVGSGDFAKNRHFLLIRDITEDGKLLVANSYKGEDGLAEWDYDRVFGQMSEAMLWVFSR